MVDQEPLHLIAPIEMSDKEKEFRAWLKLNRAFLEERCEDSIEIAWYAIHCAGFDADVVNSVCALAKLVVLTNGHSESRARAELFHWENAVERVQIKQKELELKEKSKKGLNLMPLWKELVDNVITGEAV